MNWKIWSDFFFALAFLKPYLCSTKRWTSLTSKVLSSLLNLEDRRNNLKLTSSQASRETWHKRQDVMRKSWNGTLLFFLSS